jgi:ketosteroid isomerase-like protein
MTCRRAGAVLMAGLWWTAPAWSAGDEEAVENTIKAAASATAAFSETRDPRTVLQLYAQDYLGIQDGEAETRASIEKWLADYDSELRRGSNLRFISAVSNLATGVAGSLAWVTYDYLFQAVRQGDLEGQDAGKCTSLLRKEASVWLIFHEHCSKTRTGAGK